jgi:2-C-methyl-D-erythritol 4-phosphate cytidylyltransferase
MRLSVIITAGGIGTRMGSDLPKQFLHLSGRPVLMHTIEAFHQYDPEAELVLTLPEDWKSFWLELVDEHGFRIAHQLVDGGKERFHSIKNALTHCHGDIIAVHDGVRPLVDQETIKEVVEGAKQFGQAVPVVPVKDTLRTLVNGSSKTVNRADYVLVQTPQCFQKEVIKEAYTQFFTPAFTDDASVVEHLGKKVHLVAGNETNLKITAPIDLQIAEAICNNR